MLHMGTTRTSSNNNLPGRDLPGHDQDQQENRQLRWAAWAWAHGRPLRGGELREAHVLAVGLPHLHDASNNCITRMNGDLGGWSWSASSPPPLRLANTRCSMARRGRAATDQAGVPSPCRQPWPNTTKTQSTGHSPPPSTPPSRADAMLSRD